MRFLVFFVVAGSILGCAGPTQVAVPTAYTAHVGADWFVFRAADLGIDVEAAKARDAALPEDEPPELDTTAALEGAALWGELCAKCHGMDGRGVPDSTYDPAPRKWGGFGVGMGFFFGGDGMRAGIYKKIRDGGDPVEGRVSLMAAWKDSLSREQMWALVRHIEGF